MPLSIYRPEALIARKKIPALSPGEHVDVEAEWTCPENPLAHSLIARLKPGGADYTKADNTAELNLKATSR